MDTMHKMLSADDQVIIQNNECKRQRSMFQLQQVCLHYKLSLRKTETMALMGKYPLPSKIVLGNKLSLIHI